jgi:hypothetical protein
MLCQERELVADDKIFSFYHFNIISKNPLQVAYPLSLVFSPVLKAAGA